MAFTCPAPTSQHLGRLKPDPSGKAGERQIMPPVGHHLRPQAIGLYKRLHRLGREYPDPNYHFLDKLRNASRRNAHLTEDADVKKWLDLGEFIYKEVETLYSLKKYRTLKRRYNPDS
ncbi:hypothetical protein OC845_000046 [Tilletia horrida]|nr:hypothetical protein OC845_000046 [Tilletia horrida]